MANQTQTNSGKPLQNNDFQEFLKAQLAGKDWAVKSAAIAVAILQTLSAKGMKQTELAKKMDVSPQQVNKWVKGKENFQLDTITRLEEALEIELIQIADYGRQSGVVFKHKGSATTIRNSFGAIAAGMFRNTDKTEPSFLGESTFSTESEGAYFTKAA